MALLLGCTVGELKARMGGGEFADWQAFNEASPLDHVRRIELMLAKFMAYFVNANQGKKGRSYRPKDFLPDYEPRPAQTSDQMKFVLERWYRALGGEDDKPN